MRVRRTILDPGLLALGTAGALIAGPGARGRRPSGERPGFGAV